MSIHVITYERRQGFHNVVQTQLKRTRRYMNLICLRLEITIQRMY